jgi:drug/metabolite transporter (DMT)-like permease
MIQRLFASGFGVMVASAFFFTLANVAIKFLSPSMGIMEMAFFRFAIGVVILLSLMVPTRTSLRGSQTLILLARGLAGFLAFLCFLKSVALIPLANAIVLLYTFPVFATFFCFLFLREPVSKWEIALIGAGLLGIYLLMEPGSHRYNAGDMFGLLSACFAGLAVVFVRRLVETHGTLIIYFYFCLVGAVVSLPSFLKGIRMLNLQQFLLLVVLGLTFLFGQLLMNRGFKLCKASEGSVILMSELIFTAIAGVLIFKEVLSGGFLVGAILILSSGVGLSWINRRSRRALALRG